MKRFVVLVLSMVFGMSGFAGTFYVSTHSVSDGPGTAWSNAFHTIQGAVDAATAGDTVLVTNGVYDTGVYATPGGFSVSNRVVITTSITVESVNGPESTSIVGAGPMGSNAVRCVYMTNSPVLSGFTISNGHTHLSGNYDYEQGGGGVLLDHGGTLTNCIVTECEAQRFGGGVYGYYGGEIVDCELMENTVHREGAAIRLERGGLVDRCHIHDNLADTWDGGGVYVYYEGTVRNSLIRNNAGYSGGGVYLCNTSGEGPQLYNCTVVDNTSDWDAGGVRCLNGGAVRNCIVYYNTANEADKEDNYENTGPAFSYEYTCITPSITGAGNIINAPEFMNRSGDDYRVPAGSPCLDTGTNQAWMADAVDFAAAPRMANSTVDMGAYETPYPEVVITNGNDTIYGQVTAYNIGGTSAEADGLLSWTNTLAGGSGTLAASNPWQVDGIALDFGDNAIIATATNEYGLSSSDSVTITRLHDHGPGSPTHYVSTNGAAIYPYSSWADAATNIQDAVDAASSGDTVRVDDGVYNTGGAATPGTDLANRVMIERAITLESVNGPSNTFIVGAADPSTTNGPAAVRCVRLVDGALLSGFTLTNGYTLATGDQNTERGAGGVLLDHGGTVSNCTLVGNGCHGNGGGANLHHGGILVASVLRENRSAAGDAGGALIEGGHIEDCDIFGNSANSDDGGGLLFYESGSADNVNIYSNTCADAGGGVYFWNGGTLSNSTIEANESGNGGGGMMVRTGALIEHCTIRGNHAGDGTTEDGGGIWFYTGGTVRNCLITENSAQNMGGGVMFNSAASNAVVECCTIVSNTSEYGGGVRTWGGTVRNSIVHGNTATVNSANWSWGGNSPTIEYTCITPTNGLPGGTGCIEADPQFADANYRLGATSPAINAGMNQIWMADATDFDGSPRILGGTVDMGIYEFIHAPLIEITAGDTIYNPETVFTVAGTTDGDVVGALWWTNAQTGASATFAAISPWTFDVSLVMGANEITVFGTNFAGTAASDSIVLWRHAIDSPNHYAWAGNSSPAYPYTNWATAATCLQDAVDVASGGDHVWVTNGVYDTGGMVLHGQDFTNRVVIEKDIVLEGISGSDHTFIVGAGGAGATRCVWISDGLLTGFTITNGHTQTNGDWGAYQRGGGIFLNKGGTVSNCVISGCSANITGGGVDFHYGGLVVDCTIEGNSTTANYGGGGVSLHSDALLARCIVRNNSSIGAGGDGGGLFFYSGGTARNCLIEGNTAANSDDGGASNSGGGIYVRSGADGAHIESCTIVSNTAERGGGIYTYGGTNLNCIVYGNTATISSDNWGIGSGGSPEFFFSCTIPTNGIPGGEGCITNDPAFIGGGDYRLGAASPAIGAGTNRVWMANVTELQGYPRIVEDKVDMGAYEYVGAPVLAITNAPTFVGNTVSTVDLAGTNNSWVVGTMAWTNAVNAANGTLPVSGFEFQVSSIPLSYGDNAITVSGTNVLSETTSDSVVIYREVPEDSGNSPTHYVSTNGAAIWPYTNWVQASTIIQYAVDAAANNDTVLVEGGIYDQGGELGGGSLLTNRVCIDKAITVQSIDGPSNTFIVGQSDGGGHGNAAMRGAYLVEGAELIGFTVSNGWTRAGGNDYLDEGTGGVLLYYGGIVQDCVITHNQSDYHVGGVNCWYGGEVRDSRITYNSTRVDNARCGGAYLKEGGVLTHCVISENFIPNLVGTGSGGGVYCEDGGALYDCAIHGNRANNGGGVYVMRAGAELHNCSIYSNLTLFGNVRLNWGGELTDCEIYSNISSNQGGGIQITYAGRARNCLIRDNWARDEGGGATLYDGGTLENCTVTSNYCNENGGGLYVYADDWRVRNTIVYGNDARLGNPEIYNVGGYEQYWNSCIPSKTINNCITNNPQLVGGDDYRLSAASPCIDAGMDIAAITNDMAGTPRPLDGDANGTNAYDVGCYEFVSDQADSDGDTMPDGWEDDHGLDLVVDDAAGNPDTDPFSNAEEHIADTDPNDSNDWFRITSISNGAVFFHSSSNRWYTLLGCTDLVSDAWNPVQGARMGLGGADSMTSTNNLPVEFYKLEVERP